MKRAVNIVQQSRRLSLPVRRTSSALLIPTVKAIFSVRAEPVIDIRCLVPPIDIAYARLLERETTVLRELASSLIGEPDGNGISASRAIRERVFPARGKEREIARKPVDLERSGCAPVGPIPNSRER